MRKKTFIRHSDKKIIVPRLMVSETRIERGLGLLALPELETEEGLLLQDCKLIHTIGMAYALDVVFLDDDLSVVKCIENLKPYRFAGSWDANFVLELPKATIKKFSIKTGDQLFLI